MSAVCIFFAGFCVNLVLIVLKFVFSCLFVRFFEEYGRENLHDCAFFITN